MAVSSEIKTIVKRPKSRGFRKLYLKRRELDGDYETNWQEIPTNRIVKWGRVGYGISDTKANQWKYTGFSFSLLNKDGYFNDVDDPNSFFADKLTAERSLIRVDVGYLTDSGVEVPTSSTIFIGIIGEGLERTDTSIVNIQADHITKIFDEFPASDIIGLGVTQTASDIMGKIRDHTDASSTAIFQKYISTWNIEATTINYNMATTTTLQNKTAWRLMREVAEAEDFSIYINQSGEFVFESRQNTTTVEWHFSGANDYDNSYGKTVIGAVKLDENLRNLYNRVSVQHDPADTTTSYTFKSDTWGWGDGSSSFKYGIRTYEYKNFFLDATAASTVADNIYNRFSQKRQLIKLKSKLIPGLTIDDRVTLTHQPGPVTGRARYGVARYGIDIYGQSSQGSGLNIQREECYIQNVQHNLRDFSSDYTLEVI